MRPRLKENTWLSKEHMKSEEMQFLTKEEYQKFAIAILDKPISYYAFEMLYWCGIREGELLALTPGDFDFKNNTVSINKSYQREAGVKRIRIHDIRHSHVSLLIDMGFSAVAIANRVGHESIDITYRYAHLFSSRQVDMADRLDNERMEEMEHVS